MSGSDLTVLQEFMEGHLVTWIRTFHVDEGFRLEYSDLVDGVFLHDVMQQIHPRSPHIPLTRHPEDVLSRGRNLYLLVRNIKTFYEDVLGQLVVTRLPDVVQLVKDPCCDASVSEMTVLLMLILGCAVQCDRKEVFIESIKLLDVDVQHSLAASIQEVTYNPETVWSHEWSEIDSLSEDQHDPYFRCLVSHVRKLVSERDAAVQQLTDLSLQDGGNEKKSSDIKNEANSNTPDKHHLAVEVAELKAKLRRTRQELEEKTECLAECRDDLELNKQSVIHLKQENLDLSQLARAARLYQDELDVMKERAHKADQLEAEVNRFKEKMNDIDFYKSRIDELREDNRMLEETKEMLEEQLLSARKRADQVLELESEIIKYKGQINNLVLERDADRNKLQNMIEENAQLQLAAKNSQNESATLVAKLDELKVQSTGSGNWTLGEQLNADALARVRKLELENNRLAGIIDQMRESSFHESGERILELEKENKRLSLKVQSLQESSCRETQRAIDSQTEADMARCEVRKVQETLETVKTNHERQIAEMTHEKQQLSNLVETVREHFQKLSDTRQADLEMENRRLSEKAQNLQSQVSRLETEKQHAAQLSDELRKSTQTVEMMSKQKAELQRELEKNSNCLSENSRLQEELGEQQHEVVRLRSEIQSLKNQISEMTCLQSQNAQLQEENTTLQSQSASLLSQNTALLQTTEGEKDLVAQLSKDHTALQEAHSQLTRDQEDLQRLHEQLTTEYDTLLKERDMIKVGQKELKQELKMFKEKYDNLASGEEDVMKLKETLQSERETLKCDSKSLSNLRAEHSRLKDDFRNLFTANEKLKNEYHHLQADYRGLKTENNRLKLRETEMQGMLADGKDRISQLDIELAKSNNKCELLVQLNSSLEEDRRSLMTQVSVLLEQYHDLLTQTLSDKTHFHEEEKSYTDRLNQLRRQKEKLEEKIMEQYRRMDSISPKKKGFGATLVRKVRKAGSELINKVPRTGRSRSRGRGQESTDHTDSPDNSSLESASGSGSGGHDFSDCRSDSQRNSPQELHAAEDSNSEKGRLSRHDLHRRNSKHKSTPVGMNFEDADKSFNRSRSSYSSEDIISLKGDCDSMNSSSYSTHAPYSGGLGSSSSEARASRISLGSTGTRRAVYYTDEDDTIPTRDVGPDPPDTEIKTAKVKRTSFRSTSEYNIPNSSPAPLRTVGSINSVVSMDPRLLAGTSSPSNSPLLGSPSPEASSPVTPTLPPMLTPRCWRTEQQMNGHSTPLTFTFRVRSGNHSSEPDSLSSDGSNPPTVPARAHRSLPPKMNIDSSHSNDDLPPSLPPKPNNKLIEKNMNNSSKEKGIENSIWYEYGCV